MRKVRKNSKFYRRFMRVCLPGAMSPEFRSKDGTLPGRGVFPRRAKIALVRSSASVRPPNGRLDCPCVRQPFSKFACARVFARARVALRVCDVFPQWQQVTPSYLKYYFKWRVTLPIENVRFSCVPGELVPIPESVSDLFRNVGDFALVGKYCAVYMALCVARIIVLARLLVQDSFIGIMKIVPCLGVNP